MNRKSTKSEFKKGPYGVAWKNGKLYDFTDRHVLVLKLWPDPRSWLKRPSHDWKSNRKIADTVFSRVLFPPGHVYVPRQFAPPGELTLFDTSPSMLTRVEHDRIEALVKREHDRLAAAFDTIPPEVRLELVRYKTRRWQLLNLFARCPGALDLSRSNPALAYALASNWIFHKPAVTRPWRAAQTLVKQKQRVIMKWLNFPPTESVRRILARIPPESVSVVNLFNLRGTLQHQEIARKLAHVRRINSGVLRIFTDIQHHSLASPRLLNAIGEDQEQDVNYPPVLQVLKDIRRMSRLMNRDYAARFRNIHTLGQLCAFHDELALLLPQDQAYNRLMLTEEMPPPPFVGTDSIVPIRTWHELKCEGTEMSNCVFSYINRVSNGMEYIYRVLAPVRGTLSIHRTLQGWRPAQFKKASNKKVPESIRNEVYQALFATKSTN